MKNSDLTAERLRPVTRRITGTISPISLFRHMTMKSNKLLEFYYISAAATHPIIQLPCTYRAIYLIDQDIQGEP